MIRLILFYTFTALLTGCFATYDYKYGPNHTKYREYRYHNYIDRDMR